MIASATDHDKLYGCGRELYCRLYPGAVVNNDAAMIHAIHGEPVKVATSAGLALARQALRAQREAIVAMEERAADAASSRGADTPSEDRDVFRSDPNKQGQRLSHAAARHERQDHHQPAPGGDAKKPYASVSILV
jgi:hypothetical protein